MKPIRFDSRQILNQDPEEIAHQVLDAANWPDIDAGIKTAEFEIMPMTWTAATLCLNQPRR